jgi:NADPH:quinone reductase-like Zn-dependent oxidoreductase
MQGDHLKRSGRCRWQRRVLVTLLGAMVAGSSLAVAPAWQQAVVMKAAGGPEVLKLERVPVLAPHSGQVLIRVYAAGVNPVDWKLRSHPDYFGGPARKAVILGLDVAGIIEQAGAGVSAFTAGDKVFSTLDLGADSGLNGGYSQFVVVAADRVVSKPATMSFAEAAGIGVAGVTGTRAVMQTHVAGGERVLITGVAGGVGSAAAQIARARGARVLGTASKRHGAYLHALGVEQVIDYTSGPFENQVHDVDVVIDTVGADTSVRALKTLRQGGRLITVAGDVLAQQCAQAKVSCIEDRAPGAALPSEGDMLRAVATLAAAGKYSVSIDKTFALGQAGAAQAYGERGHTQGKIILIVDAAAALRK